MRAIVQTSFGEPAKVLELRNIEAPILGDDDVLVRVKASGVAKGDWLLTEGQPYIARPMFGFRTPKQPVAGIEVAGRIEALGANVRGFNLDDDVFGKCNGAFADYVAVNHNQIVHKPANITFEQAAAVPVSGSTALQAVRDIGEVKPGHKVLIIGASGGVGSFAVQIAKAYGASVTGVCSTGNVEMVRAIGADEVIDYTRDEIEDDGRYDVILDIAGNRSISTLRRALAPRGTLVMVGGTGGSVTMGFGRTLRAMALAPFVRQRLRSFMSTPNKDDLTVLKELMESGEITPVVEETYPLSRTAEAVTEAGRGSSRGKRVVTA